MYPTNLSETRWQFIKKVLQFDERKRKHSLRSIWNALSYLVKTGCQWWMLPANFAKWQLVYYYHKKWSFLECYGLLLSRLREKVRSGMGQKGQPSLGIMDSQGVGWGNNRALNSYDGNKKVKGIKRHVVVDKNGFLLAVMVTVAGMHDGKAVLLLMRVLKGFLCGIKAIIADGGYRGELAKQIRKSFGYLIEVVMRSDNKKKASNRRIKDG